MSSADITIYAYNFRSRAERVIWALNELHLDYKLIRLDPMKGETMTPEFGVLNPVRKIPVLVHNGEVYTESLAVIEYLDSLNDEISLLPRSPEENYRLRHMISYLMSEVEAYLWIADQSSRLKQFYHWPEGTHQASLARIEKNIGQAYALIKEDNYALGDRFSMADIYAYHIFIWAIGYGIKVPSNVADYLHSLGGRPALPENLRINPQP